MGRRPAGADYTAFTDTLIVFPCGASDGDAQLVTIEVLDDALVEGRETVVLGITNLSRGQTTTGEPSLRGRAEYLFALGL